MTTNHLCHTCAGFDIRALYELAVSRVCKSKPTKSTVGGFSAYEGFPDFYNHHHNLQSLSTSAENGCSLCSSIWQQCAKLLPADTHARKSSLPAGKFGEQITLGLSNWSPEAEGMPYLTAVQQLPRGAVTILATFDVFIEPGHAPTGFETMLARAVQTDPASEASLKIAKTWHQECLASHQTCTRMLPQERPLPNRIIDVGDASRNPRLIATAGQAGLWAALSYCWGGHSAFVLNKDTSESFFGGIVPLFRFPKTLLDAISVTRALGLRFLWIDALCIMQDSAEDWAAEAGRMKDVYGGAAITIGATNSASVDEGIFKDRSILSETCSLEWRSSNLMESKTVFLRSATEFWDTTMKNEPLNTRGWTLQESLLAPRTLSYSSQQMIWECLERKVGECGRPVLPGERHRDKKFVQTIMANDFSAWEKAQQALARLSLKMLPSPWTAVPQSWELSHSAMYSRWFDIVRDYTGRNLTVQSDTLPALSGVARAFQICLHDKYCAGLWKNDMIRGMCWARFSVRKRDLRAIKASQKERSDCLPSWSWASIVGDRVMNFLEDERVWPFTTVEETAQTLHVSVSSKYDDVYGHIAHAEIVIKAPFQYIDNPVVETLMREPTTFPVLRERITHEMQSNTFQEEFEQQHRSHWGQKFAALRLMQTSQLQESIIKGQDVYMPRAEILIIESVGEVDKWRRVGLIEVAVPAWPDADDRDLRFFDEMKRAKWEWREFSNRNDDQVSNPSLDRFLLALELSSDNVYRLQYQYSVVLPAFVTGSSSRGLLRFIPAILDRAEEQSVFQYEFRDYYIADPSEIPSLEKLTPGDQSEGTLAQNGATNLQATLISVPKGTEAARYLLFTLESGKGTIVRVDVGQIARSRSYAYVVEQPQGATGDVAPKEVKVYSAWKCLTDSGLELVVINGGIHLNQANSKVELLSLLGKFYPENVAFKGKGQSLKQALEAGKGLPEAGRFIHSRNFGGGGIRYATLVCRGAYRTLIW